MSDAARTCEACLHAALGPVDPNNIGAPRPLLCRRYPPTQSFVHLGGGNVTAIANQPSVPPGGTCGEWSPSGITLN